MGVFIAERTEDLKQQIEERIQIEEELAQHRDNLEQLVDARTHELSVTNELLQKTEARIRVILESSPDIIMNIDRDTSVSYINKKTIKGISVQNIIGRRLFDYLIPEDKDEYKAAILAVQEGKGMQTLESKMKLPDGEVYWFESRFTAINSPGDIDDIMIIAIDITERKNVEL